MSYVKVTSLSQALQGRSSRILIGPADFPPPMGEVWFLGLGGLSLRPEGRRLSEREARRAESRGGVLGERVASLLPTS